MVSGVRARGGDAAALLRSAGVARECLDDPAARVPIADYAALYNTVARALDDEGFALFSAPLPTGTFEFLCRGVLSSRTLGEALERAARFLRLAVPDLAVAVRREGPVAILEISERRALQRARDDPRRVFAFEWLLRLLHGLACWLAGRGLIFDAVRFPYPRPPHAAEYVRIYTEHSTFDGPRLAARMDAALLDLPVRREEADLVAFLEGAPGRISMLYRPDRAVARAVRECLAPDLAAAPTFEQTARRLNMSPRTLHRKLREEGSSFRAIKESLRRERALARLARPRSSVAQTAAELGYSEPSAFFRAFHAWTGEAPSVYRKRSTGR